MEHRGREDFVTFTVFQDRRTWVKVNIVRTPRTNASGEIGRVERWESRADGKLRSTQAGLRNIWVRNVHPAAGSQARAGVRRQTFLPQTSHKAYEAGSGSGQGKHFHLE